MGSCSIVRAGTPAMGQGRAPHCQYLCPTEQQDLGRDEICCFGYWPGKALRRRRRCSHKSILAHLERLEREAAPASNKELEEEDWMVVVQPCACASTDRWAW